MTRDEALEKVRDAKGRLAQVHEGDVPTPEMEKEIAGEALANLCEVVEWVVQSVGRIQAE